MKKALVTGANKGIGLETTAQLLQKGYYVYLGSRNDAKGMEAINKLHTKGLTNVELVKMDVDNAKSVKAAREHIGLKTKALDLLINNAGINGGSPYTALEATEEQLISTFNTNLFGVARVTQTFIDLLKKSPEPRIVNVSSSVGSLALQSDPKWPAYDFAKYAIYGASKAALNMYTIQLAYELRNTSFKINSVCPGYTSTDFTDHHGGDVQLAARRIIKYATIDQSGPTGKFFSEESNPDTGIIPW